MNHSLSSAPFLLIIVPLLSLQACSVRMPVPAGNVAVQREVRTQTPYQASAKMPVYVVADSLHTSLAVSYDWLVKHGYRAPKDLTFPQGPYRYVQMSWGNRVAYIQKRWLYPWEVFNALFLPSPSVTEVIPVSWKIEEVSFQQRVYRGEVEEYRGRALAAFLNSCNKLDDGGHPQVIAPSSWGQGYLLDCKHAYFFPRICNVWTGQSLESCGLDISMHSALSANGLLRQVEQQGFVKIHDGMTTQERKTSKTY